MGNCKTSNTSPSFY